MEIDPTGDAAYINETGLLLQDDRIAVLAVTIVGQDYDFAPDAGGTPVERMLPTAAERLLPGAGPDDDTTPTTPEATATATDAPDPAIPDDFPLTARLAEGGRGRRGAEGPVPQRRRAGPGGVRHHVARPAARGPPRGVVQQRRGLPHPSG
ncbi:hypothetical protein G5V59_23295 [Nocardioides sp. W3-2-3]|uniref:hypothetical protein n=1 Tax=Nocardioides convexus TaxID=2712224 RepID=UPI00241868EE|nr:hypothetical protein [Nocardioides convexus]NHA01673.1 hypothetical protein [Nocardioides convexus]